MIVSNASSIFPTTSSALDFSAESLHIARAPCESSLLSLRLRDGPLLALGAGFSDDFSAFLSSMVDFAGCGKGRHILSCAS
jgi:hypothetical protein